MALDSELNVYLTETIKHNFKYRYTNSN